MCFDTKALKLIRQIMKNKQKPPHQTVHKIYLYVHKFLGWSKWKIPFYGLGGPIKCMLVIIYLWDIIKNYQLLFQWEPTWFADVSTAEAEKR